MNQRDSIGHLIPPNACPLTHEVSAFAPSNIALVKYWGKRNATLNLPLTDSLSISLDHLGATTSIKAAEYDQYWLNNTLMDMPCDFSLRLCAFLNLFRHEDAPGFYVRTQMNIPMAAGLASSACGYAALTEALNQLFAWNLDKQALSQISRLGSGSASRSHWHGFVHWHHGVNDEGKDCFSEPLPQPWNDLRILVLPNTHATKSISSREAMLRCQNESPLFSQWPELTSDTLMHVQKAIAEKDIEKLGQQAQSHAVAMHEIMHACKPAIDYNTPTSLAQKQAIITMQNQGAPVYFTQDAGPHIKVITLANQVKKITAIWPAAILINPWSQN